MTTSEIPQVAAVETEQEETLAPLDLRSLFVAGVHFGHPSKRWNPKMEEYIFAKRSRAHIIDLSKTVTSLSTTLRDLALPSALTRRNSTSRKRTPDSSMTKCVAPSPCDGEGWGGVLSAQLPAGTGRDDGENVRQRSHGAAGTLRPTL